MLFYRFLSTVRLTNASYSFSLILFLVLNAFVDSGKTFLTLLFLSIKKTIEEFLFVYKFLKCKSPKFPQDRLIGIAIVGRVEKESRVWIFIATAHVVRRARYQALNAANNLSTDHSIRRQPLARLSFVLLVFPPLSSFGLTRKTFVISRLTLISCDSAFFALDLVRILFSFPYLAFDASVFCDNFFLLFILKTHFAGKLDMQN